MSSSPTNKKFKKPARKFDVSAFDADLSSGEPRLSTAIERFRNAVFSGVVTEVLTELLDKERKGHLFEFTYLVIDDGLAFTLREELLSGFSLEDSATSLSGGLLQRLSLFFSFLPYPSDDVKPSRVDENYQFAQQSQKAIDILVNSGFMQPGSPVDPKSNDEFLQTSKRKGSQKQAKRSRSETMTIDIKPFLDLQEAVPSTISEAQELALKLLEKRKELLGHLLDLIREPSLSEFIRNCYIPPTINATAPHSPQGVESDSRYTSAQLTVVDDNTPLSSAYPYVQPMKASLFFDSAEGFGEWRIYMSTTAIKHLRAYHSGDQMVFQIILEKLKELSNGVFSDDNQKRLKGPSKGIPIFEARLKGRLAGDLRIVYQVDLATDYETSSESQGIRIYGIFTHAQMDSRMWESLSAQLACRGSEYRRKIDFRRKPRGGGSNLYLPQSWPEVSQAQEPLEDAKISSLVEAADLQQIHQWLVLEKYSTFSQALLNCILSDKDSSPVFSVSPFERDIIEHPSSCYVLGRSGTGKTTTMTFKIFGIERTAKSQFVQLNTDAKPRQLFVTQSPVLASRVREYYVKLSEFLSAALGTPPSPNVRQSKTEEGLDDEEDDEDWRSDLPKRFSELEDSHFPLFLTFDKLCKLVEADLGISFSRPKYTKEQKRAERRYTLVNAASNLDLDDMEGDESPSLLDLDFGGSSNEAERSSRVDFDKFVDNYWPRFPEDLTKSLDPSLVFSEFLGVIKGSEQSMESESGYLSREVYLGLSHRTQSTFATQREKIYRLFEKYMALKREYRHYDLADRCHAITRCMMRDGYGCSVDFLYVDEAQDNLIIDTFLLRRLCRNPHGLFWAGDTAQKIAAGSSFRFDDLKSALYRFERHLYPSVLETSLVQPEFFQLTTNYRSHDGIVNCADLVIQVITHFWPDSIDKLRREKGLVHGPKPVFFTGWNDETARYEQFLLGESGDAIEFGAQQCILVRNDRARNELRKQFGRIGVIMTLYESKGLEFDDVLLYDFFKDSPCTLSQWRVVLNFLSERLREEMKNTAPPFNENRHAGICNELKFLYVAVTRARKNLWIIDRSEKGDPMKKLLVQMGKVEICTPDKAPRLAVASSAEEWKEAGKRLFKNMRFQQAMHCFERAGLPVEYAIAEAYLFRHQARNVLHSSSEKARQEAFKKAAHAFFKCGQMSSISKEKYYHISAECFREAREFGEAASSYENAGEYTRAATCYAKAVMFDDALRIVDTTGKVGHDTTERIIGAARLHYIHVGRLDDALKRFDSREEALAFMEDCGFDTARATVLEKLGQLREAAELYFRDGDSQRAIELSLQDVQDLVSDLEPVKHATKYLLRSLWKQYSFGLDTRSCDDGLLNQLHTIQDSYKAVLPPEIVEELSMFQAISSGNRTSLLNTYGKFLRRNNPQSAALILDHLLTPDYQIDEMQDAVLYLRACYDYARIMKDVWNYPELTGNSRTQKLFGFEKESEDEFRLLDGCCLVAHVMESQLFGTIETIVNLSSHELTRAIKSVVKARLLSKVEAQVAICSKARTKSFGDPCLIYAIQGQCRREACNRQHIDRKSVNMAWFNTRVRIHLLQILFLHTADFAINYRILIELRRDWISNLYRVLNPPLAVYGSPANVAAVHIPELKEGLPAVELWIEGRKYSSSSLNTITEVLTIALWHGNHTASNIIYRARFHVGERIYHGQDRILEQFGIPALLRTFDTLSPTFIQSGCMFIQHVIDNRLIIDVDHVCRLIELLSGASILLDMNASRGLHNCLLPRSWILYQFPRLNFDQSSSIRASVWRLVQVCAHLLSHLLLSSHNEQDHLHGGYFAKSIAIQRICRAMTFLGCNTTRYLRDFVLERMKEFRTAINWPMHDLYVPYLLSSSWSGLLRAVEMSRPPSTIDELVQLVQHGRPALQILSSRQLCRIEFKDKQELFSMFGQARKGPSRLSVTAPVFVPRSSPSNVQTSSTVAQPRVAKEEDVTTVDETDEFQEDNEEAGGHDDLANEPEGAELADQSTTLVLTFTITLRHKFAARIIMRFLKRLLDRKERAARILQRAYRLLQAQKRMLEAGGIWGDHAKFHRSCVLEAREKNWPSSHRRVVFLGLVPNLLVCLETLRTKNQIARAKSRNQLKEKLGDTKIDYDQVNSQISQANKIGKRLDKLKDRLSVKSDWHMRRSIDDLRVVTEEIIQLLDELKIGPDVREMCMEVKDSIQKKRPPRPEKTKPTLNVDDLDEVYDY